MKDRLREALVEITKLDCSFDMWPRSAAVEIAEAALASQPSGQPVTSAPSPIWPESPCRVCGKPTIDEGGYCSDECLEKSEPIKSPSDHAAVKDEHRKLAAGFFASISAETLIEGQVENLLAQWFADFARDSRLKEAEWRTNHWPPLGALISVASLQRWIAERGIENTERIEQLKRGQI